MNGQTSEDKKLKISALTGEYQTNEKSTMADVLSTTSVEVENVRGLVVEVVSETYMDDSTGTNVSMTEQKMLVSGTLARATDVTASGTPAKDAAYTISVSAIASTAPGADAYMGIYVEGELYIPAGTNNAVTFAVSSGMVTVTGEISSNGEIIGDGKIPATSLTGTAYEVGTTDTVYYISGFDAAYAAIASANSQTITVYGELELSAEYTVAQGQIIEFSDNAAVTISENGDVTIQNGGYINGQVAEVKGVLTVIYGGTTEVPAKYAVRTTNANNDVIYSGLAYALDNASEGETVNLVQSTDVDGSLTIPADVTLDVNSGAKLTISRNLTVEGTLDNHGAVSVGRNVTVSGTVDNTEMGTDGFNVCTANTDKDEYDVTVSGTGSIVFTAAPADTSDYNGAYFQNDDGQTVFTTLSNAVASVAGYDVIPGITVIGEYSENSTVDAAGNITIAPGATVSVTEIVLDDCTLDIDGTFTGAVTGQSGEDGSTVTSTVQLNKVTKATVSNADSVNDANVTVWTTTFAVDAAGTAEAPTAGTLSGTVTVSAGTVTVGDVTINKANDAPAMTVANGATLVVPADVILESNGMTINGAVTVMEDGTFDANAGTVIAGSVDIEVGGSMTAAGITITGAVNVAENEEEAGTFTVDGIVTIGEKPKTLGATATGAIVGKVAFGSSGTPYIKAYAGADMTGTVFAENEGVDTQYYINDVLYMTVYAKDSNTNAVITTLGSNATEEYEMPAYQTGSIEYVDADGEDLPNGAKVGSVEAVYATVKASNIGGVISVGNGLTMYIDGLTTENFTATSGIPADFRYQLSVGTHTVSIAANAGYNADNVVITFNGQTVQNGGTIEVTADMYADGFTLAASGAVPAQSVAPSGDSGDDGMSLTDILLIVLVVLILVMAIIVALRLMRS